MDLYYEMKAILLSLSLLTWVQCNNVSPGQYSQWREKLEFNAGDPTPDCKSKCNERCGPEQKGVSLCGSLMEHTDTLPDELVDATTEKVIFMDLGITYLKQNLKFNF